MKSVQALLEFRIVFSLRCSQKIKKKKKNKQLQKKYFYQKPAIYKMYRNINLNSFKNSIQQ